MGQNAKLAIYTEVMHYIFTVHCIMIVMSNVTRLSDSCNTSMHHYYRDLCDRAGVWPWEVLLSSVVQSTATISEFRLINHATGLVTPTTIFRYATSNDNILISFEYLLLRD